MLYYNNVYRQLSDIGCFLSRSGVVLVLDVVGCKVNTFFSNSQIFRPFLFFFRARLFCAGKDFVSDS